LTHIISSGYVGSWRFPSNGGLRIVGPEGAASALIGWVGERLDHPIIDQTGYWRVRFQAGDRVRQRLVIRYRPLDCPQWSQELIGSVWKLNRKQLPSTCWSSIGPTRFHRKLRPVAVRRNSGNGSTCFLEHARNFQEFAELGFPIGVTFQVGIPDQGGAGTAR